MREILFRGKRIDNGEWSKGDLLYDTEQNEAYIAEYFEAKAAYFRQVIPETVGEYTGLTDKNGKMIFEGDIITANVYEREYEDDYLSNNPIKVSYCSGYFYPFHLEGAWRSGVSNINVIGNIHDNPELLKGGEE